MPILEPAPDDSDLSQGDVLKGVRLFETKESWLDEGGQSKKAPGDLCLVISRSCVAAHKDRVVVANVAKFPDAIPKHLDNFDRALHFLISMRDGFGTPDVFFLGQIPNEKGRFCARLDSLHTVYVPTDAAARIAFLKERRIARLCVDFLRDLHVRIFSAFASLGFDDQGWIPTEELKWLVEKGIADVMKAKAALADKRAEHGAKDAGGDQSKRGEIERLEAALAEIEQRVKPFEEELASRV